MCWAVGVLGVVLCQTIGHVPPAPAVATPRRSGGRIAQHPRHVQLGAAPTLPRQLLHVDGLGVGNRSVGLRASRDARIHDVLPANCYGGRGISGGEVWIDVQRLGRHRAGFVLKFWGMPCSSWTSSATAFSAPRHQARIQRCSPLSSECSSEAARTAGLGTPAWNTTAWQAGLGGNVGLFRSRFLKKRTRPPRGRPRIQCLTVTMPRDARCSEARRARGA